MLATDTQVHSLEELRQLVYQTLCRHEQLRPGMFPMTERILTRGGRPCGIYFCLHGPRSVKSTSIWETDKNSVLFYGHRGERFERLYLAESPQLYADALINRYALEIVSSTRRRKRPLSN
jgi:hypothetical protein